MSSKVIILPELTPSQFLQQFLNREPDITLKCKERHFRVHGFLMQIVSYGYFTELFMSNKGRQQVYDFSDLDADAIEAVLITLYGGKTKISMADIPKVLAVGQKWQFTESNKWSELLSLQQTVEMGIDDVSSIVGFH